MKLVVIAALLAILTGCDQSKPQAVESHCFSVTPASGQRPYLPIMTNECTGESWLMVEVALSDKPADGFTYRWYKLDKIDFRPPTLVRN